MELPLIRLLFDTGLFILIWLVQLIIYPSFKFYHNENLIKWHDTYTRRISVVVIPLMLGQLFISFYQAILTPEIYSLGTGIMVLGAWLVTFTYFVPAHKALSNGNYSKSQLDKLVKINWWRTLLWSIIFFWSLYRSLKS